MGPKSLSGGVGWGYLRPVQFLDHLTVIKTVLALLENDMAVLKKVYMAESDKKESIF